MKAYILEFVFATGEIIHHDSMDSIEQTEWVIVLAETLEEAKLKYEETFDLWEQDPDKFYSDLQIKSKELNIELP